LNAPFITRRTTDTILCQDITTLLSNGCNLTDIQLVTEQLITAKHYIFTAS